MIFRNDSISFEQKKDEISWRRSQLSAVKQALLEKRLYGNLESNAQLQLIPRRSQRGLVPLSFAQQRIWFLHQLEPNSAAYNQVASIHVTGSLDLKVLEQSLNEIIQRHEALRTNFAIAEEESVQIIAPALTITLPIVDLRNLPKVEREQEIQRRTTEEVQQLFDLEQGPLLRSIVLHLSETEYLLQITMHHIVTDGWTWGVLVCELVALYEAFSVGKPSTLPELPIQYADFAVWQRQWLTGEVLETQVAYWKQQLNNLPTLQLPTDRPRPTVQAFRGARQTLMLPKALSEKLKVMSQQEGITLFMLLLGAFKTLLNCYTQQDDIVVGTDIANRNRPEIEGLIGFFVNQLVLRTNLSGNPTFRELLGRVRDCALSAYAHQDLPFEKLLNALKLERTRSRMPLFQVKFVLQNAPLPPFEISDLTIKILDEVETGETKLDLFLELRETEQGLKGLLEYDTDLFDASTITRMLKHFEIILETVVTQPNTKLNELEQILKKIDKQQQIVHQVKQKEVSYQKLKNIKRKVISENL
jgi:hypothetical protein